MSKQLTREQYDTREGIAQQLKSLEGLNALIEARRIAGYDRRERLSAWVILNGRFYLDTTGNMNRILTLPRHKKVLLDPPSEIMSYQAFLEWYIGKYGESCRVSGCTIPPTHIRCAVCRETWTIDNVDDCVPTSITEELLRLDAYVGESFAQARAKMDLTFVWFNDALRIISPELRIRNNALIGSSEANENGWLYQAVQPDRIINSGDEVHVYVQMFEHHACHKERIALGVERTFRKVFEAAGYRWDSLTSSRVPDPPSWEGKPYQGPELLVTTPLNQIAIGWRKRVIEIRWSCELGDLFGDVETQSKGPHYVYAYEYDEAASFLRRIRNWEITHTRR